MFNSIDSQFDAINSRVDGSGFLTPNPQKPNTCLAVRDIRILSDSSIFEEFDAVRKSYQYDKDFINDQGSISGPGIVNNMIKNILCTKLGSLSHDPNFGVDLTHHLFEQLDWVAIIAIRDHIANQLMVNLPPAVEIEEVDIKANEDSQANTIDIGIAYFYTIPEDEFFSKSSTSGPGPTLETKKVTFTLGVDGFTGFGFANKTQFRRSTD